MNRTPRMPSLDRILGAAILAIAALGCETLPTGPAEGPTSMVRGITIVDWTADGYGRPAATISLDALAATGANTVVIIATTYQSDGESGLPRLGDPRTPTESSVKQLLGVAKARGLRPALKPHLDLDDGSWRGRIAPVDPSAWFESYRAFILPWAVLAQSEGVSQFVIGTELAGTIGHEDEWRRTIAAVRKVFTGEVIYAASWDEAGRVPFWDAVDLVGIDFYFPVAVRHNAGRLELLAGWQPWLDRLHQLHRQTGREILLTEIGYRSVDGAGMEPHAFASGATLDLGEQADLYWAALQATGDQAWIRGLCWWNWPADGSGGAQNADYTPAGKPAASELVASWGGN